MTINRIKSLKRCLMGLITLKPFILKKSVEFTPAKKIQHKFDKLFRLMSRV